MNKLITLVLVAPILIIASSSAIACDDKACEKAYLSSTTQYIANDGRHAKSARSEREAHAKNRERRDYAVVNHIQRERFFLSAVKK